MMELDSTTNARIEASPTFLKAEETIVACFRTDILLDVDEELEDEEAAAAAAAAAASLRRSIASSSGSTCSCKILSNLNNGGMKDDDNVAKSCFVEAIV